MPIFEYACNGCGHRFERLTLSAAEAAACPRCQTSDVARCLSAFAVGERGGGGGSADFTPRAAAGACGSCGDPRGPGACDLN